MSYPPGLLYNRREDWYRVVCLIDLLPFKHGSNFLARILCVPFVDDIEEWCKIAILLTGTVYTVIDGNEANISFRESYLSVVAYLQIISSKTAHILYDYGSDIARVHLSDHVLKIWAVKVRTAVTIIHKELCIREPLSSAYFLSIAF